MRPVRESAPTDRKPRRARLLAIERVKGRVAEILEQNATAGDGVAHRRFGGTVDEVTEEILRSDRRRRRTVHNADVGRGARSQLAEKGLVQESTCNDGVGVEEAGVSFESDRRVLPPGALDEKCGAQRPQHRGRHAVGAEPDRAALGRRSFDVEAADAVVGIRFRTVDQMSSRCG